MSARLSDEAGFTVVELLTAMVVGLAVVAAAMVLVGRASWLNTTTQNRVDAHQRGRAGLETMVTELRSGVCVVSSTDPDAPEPPIIHGDGTRVEFYANNRGPNDPPERRVLRYDTATRAIWEDAFQGTATDANNSTGQTVVPIPDANRVGVARQVLANVYPRDAGVPIFTYWSYGLTQTAPPPNAKYAVTGQTIELPTPIQATSDRFRVSQVQIAIRVRPAGMASPDNNPLDAILEGAAFARPADPANAVVSAVTQLPTGEYVGQPISCK